MCGECNSCFNVSGVKKINILTMDEKIELDELRRKNRIYESLCISDKINSAWEYGFQAGKFSGNDNSIETKNKLFLEDKENIIMDELQILLGESILEDDRHY